MATRPTISAERAASLVTDGTGLLPATRPAYRALADALRLAVADGRIPRGTRLPSERDLTASLGVIRTTVAGAYAVLRERGYLVSRRGSGSIATLPQQTRHGTTGSLFPADPGPDVIDLTCAATRAPTGVAEAYEAAVARLPRYLEGHGYLTLGVPELREAIAARYTERGLPTTADEIVVTSGAVAALSIVAAAFARRGDRVLVESPTYPNSVGALRRTGVRLIPTPVDSAGWHTPTLTADVAAARGSLALLLPDFHNPTGALMPDDVRAPLAAALRSTGTIPVVDETVAEVALDVDGPLPRPFAAHHSGTVTVGSASKSHWGGLRTGWIRVPRHLLRAIVEARVTIDPGAPVLEQLVLHELLTASPGLAPGRRTDLVASRDALVTALRERLPGIRFAVPHGGMSLWCELPDEPHTADAIAVAAAAEVEGLLIAAGPRFAPVGGLGRWLRIPFVQPPPVMTDAVGRLARAVDRDASALAASALAGAGPAGAGPARSRDPARPFVA
ncbi:MAG: PLP-dependent aminotransferase family protein [Dermatophilaceae bacterium]